mgnify:CR=1 FL=1
MHQNPDMPCQKLPRKPCPAVLVSISPNSAREPGALQVFLHEFRITHPVGVDRAIDGDPVPATMRAYQMQGTPTLVLIDRQGRRRFQQFGRIDDLAAGAEVMSLVRE